MTVRRLHETDLPILRAMAEASGYEYPSDLSSPHIEAVLIVADDEDRPIMACAAERIVQLYLYVRDATPGAKMAALRLLHKEMPEVLKAKGYTEAEAFIPPCVELQFSRRLERSFQWKPNWRSWFRRL